MKTQYSVRDKNTGAIVGGFSKKSEAENFASMIRDSEVIQGGPMKTQARTQAEINAELQQALSECGDVLLKIAQTARIENRTELFNYAKHGAEIVLQALNNASK